MIRWFHPPAASGETRTNASNHLQGFLSFWAAFCLLFVCLPGRRILVFAFLTFFFSSTASPLFCLPSRASSGGILHLGARPPSFCLSLCCLFFAPHISAYLSPRLSPLLFFPFSLSLLTFRYTVICGPVLLSFAPLFHPFLSPFSFYSQIHPSLCAILFCSFHFSPFSLLTFR